MTRDYEPCLCGDPECKRCFPWHEDVGDDEDFEEGDE